MPSVDELERRLGRPLEPHEREWAEGVVAEAEPEATCVTCGCTDSRACEGGCGWQWVDRRARRGLCTSCVPVRTAQVVLEERRSVVAERRQERDPTARKMLDQQIAALDRELEASRSARPGR